MLDLLITKLHDTKFMIMLLTSVAAIATVFTLASHSGLMSLAASIR